MSFRFFFLIQHLLGGFKFFTIFQSSKVGFNSFWGFFLMFLWRDGCLELSTLYQYHLLVNFLTLNFEIISDLKKKSKNRRKNSYTISISQMLVSFMTTKKFIKTKNQYQQIYTPYSNVSNYLLMIFFGSRMEFRIIHFILVVMSPKFPQYGRIPLSFMTLTVLKKMGQLSCNSSLNLGFAGVYL